MKNKPHKLIGFALAFCLFSVGTTLLALSFMTLAQTIKQIEIKVK